jgi:hypothetical protein
LGILSFFFSQLAFVKVLLRVREVQKSQHVKCPVSRHKSGPHQAPPPLLSVGLPFSAKPAQMTFPLTTGRRGKELQQKLKDVCISPKIIQEFRHLLLSPISLFFYSIAHVFKTIFFSLSSEARPNYSPPLFSTLTEKST